MVASALSNAPTFVKVKLASNASLVSATDIPALNQSFAPAVTSFVVDPILYASSAYSCAIALASAVVCPVTIRILVNAASNSLTLLTIFFTIFTANCIAVFTSPHAIANLPVCFTLPTMLEKKPLLCLFAPAICCSIFLNPALFSVSLSLELTSAKLPLRSS